MQGKTSIRDEEFVAKFRKALFSDLRVYDLEHIGFGGLPTFSYIERPSLRVKWIIDDDQDRRRLQKLRNRSFAIDWIESLENDRNFEFLGGLLMRKLGASRVHITPPGNEFGIDFLAIVPAFSKSKLFISGGRGVRIVGQSKYYKSAVAREKIQSFNDCMTSIRNNREELTRIIPAWFRNCSAPLMGCFVAHSGYQQGARVNAEQNGHILLDTRAASEILISIERMDHVKDNADLSRQLWHELRAIEKNA
ncbi:restriction endonuclease [Rhizobium sp. C1]|uniref:restriction endonuclease n=1 Tax=Rhizobium sp. C1 TaxID=1349799 RepID=UPI001E6509B0|nr:restriction endonuclease [Rhizobium sp. C1]MCD2176794.1 restriction endonuclease [Rhizobium sp. C1]